MQRRHARPSSMCANRLGAYNPDTSRRISRLPAYMEIILESERRKDLLNRGRSGSHTDWYISSVRRWSQNFNPGSTLKALFNRRRISAGGAQQPDSSAQASAFSSDDLVAEGKALCLEYVNHRLRRSGVLTQRQLDILGPPAEYSEVGEELRLVGEELETMYPDLFKNVHRQLNLAMHSEEVAKRTFSLFCEQLCRDGIHWGKVVALFAMAGAFATDCASQGRPDFAPKIVDAFGVFVATRLCGWLTQQGGWIIPEVTRSNKAKQDHTAAWIFASFAALTVLACVLLFA